MTSFEKSILERFKGLLLKRLSVHKIILFGSRARGDSTEYSDMDVLVILDKIYSEMDRDYVSECAREAGVAHGIVIVPVIYTNPLKGTHCWQWQ